MKSRNNPLLKLCLLSFFLSLAACGGGGGSGDDDDSTTTDISGKAEAPAGVIAHFERKPIVFAIADFIFKPVHSGITGLQAVGGATVELIRIDNDGNQVGAVLASTVTSITGDYSLSLPTGVSLAGDLIVRITGATASMSAMVVDMAVDINPVSQFVLDKFVDDPTLVLADLAINEVVALNGRVEQFDLTATADLSTMLAQLEAEVGQFVDNEVAIINATPDDGTASAAVAGNWNIIEFDLGMGDNEAVAFGTFFNDVFAEVIAVTDDGNGTLTLTDGALLVDAFSNYNVDNTNPPAIASIFHEVSITSENDMFPATIDASGIISVTSPFEEELETVDTQVDLDGPDFGWRYPPSTVLLHPAANNNTYVLNAIEASVRYETTDTNNDGVKDAIDPNARAGDEVSMDLTLLLKQGSGMSTASISGDYGWVALNINLDTAPPATGIFDSTVGLWNFNAGTVSIAANEQDVREVTRTAASLTNVTLTPSQFNEPPAPENFLYSVSPTGVVALDTAGENVEGYANADGSIMAFVDSVATGTPEITNVNQEMLIFVKLGTAMASSLNGASYNLYPMVVGMGQDGFSEISSLSNGIAVFNADATTATIDGTDRGFGRGTDVSQVESIVPESAPADVFTVDSIAANGAVSMSTTDTTLKGFASADGNLLIMRVYGNDSNGDQDIGLLIGVKQ